MNVYTVYFSTICWGDNLFQHYLSGRQQHARVCVCVCVCVCQVRVHVLSEWLSKLRWYIWCSEDKYCCGTPNSTVVTVQEIHPSSSSTRGTSLHCICRENNSTVEVYHKGVWEAAYVPWDYTIYYNVLGNVFSPIYMMQFGLIRSVNRNVCITKLHVCTLHMMCQTE